MNPYAQKSSQINFIIKSTDTILIQSCSLGIKFCRLKRQLFIWRLPNPDMQYYSGSGIVV
jgi:hypothetical protein